MIVRHGMAFALTLSALMLLAAGHFYPIYYSGFYVLTPCVILYLYDIQSHHNVLRNYPIIGHLRYMFEFIRPEIQQYFVATNLSGRPYNREQRSVVYQRAKNQSDAHPFGTEHDLTQPGYCFAEHAMNPTVIPQSFQRISVGGNSCQQPYLASRINISGMSFGALSGRAIQALNLGAKQANMAHNTGEGGISKHHLMHGGDLIYQIGTGYFGCRHPDGQFNLEAYQQQAQLDVVKMIELKISQGAKPSHGGWLPGPKIDAEIAEARGIPVGQDCHSPAHHQAFDSPITLMHFMATLREHSQGKPVGFKLCVGRKVDFMALCKAMIDTNIYPDFITIDGAEGGTGAAPLEFSNRLGLPGDEALNFVHNALVGCDIRHHIRLITSGHVATAFDVVKKLALGADICHIARAMMFSIGCIQAMSCHTNTCPTGITTQDPARQKAIVVPQKAQQVATYHAATIQAAFDMMSAMGIPTPDVLGPQHILSRIHQGHAQTLADLYPQLTPNSLLNNTASDAYASPWSQSCATQFGQIVVQ